MSVPRLLLLTGVPPSNVGVGGIFLYDLCCYYPRDRISCFALCITDHNPLPDDLAWLPVVYKARPRESMFQGGGRRLYKLRLQAFRRPVCSIARVGGFFLWQRAKKQIPSLIDQAVQFGRQQSIDMVWAPLHEPTIVYMARTVALELGARLITLVWDPLEYVFSNILCLDTISSRSLLGEFESTLRAAERCGVASEAMKNEYESKYGIKSVVLRHGIHPSKWKRPAKSPNNGRQFVIGFAGTLYAVREWRALISALSRVNWHIGGSEISLLLVGNHDKFLRGDDHIRYLGWRHIDEVIDLFSTEVDVAYLPYWFDEYYRSAAELCFPAKLTTYLASGRPVLFHGPKYASLTDFFTRFPVGPCCHSLESPEIIECLYQLITDTDFYASATKSGRLAMNQELDLRVFLNRFATLVGIRQDELLPI